jgi:hypothetical protein
MGKAMKKKQISEADLQPEDNKNHDSNVSPQEKSDLRKSAGETPGDESEIDAEEASLDDSDEDGDPLNEGNLKTDRFGEDLDLPESEEVDEEE